MSAERYSRYTVGRGGGGEGRRGGSKKATRPRAIHALHGYDMGYERRREHMLY